MTSPLPNNSISCLLLCATFYTLSIAMMDVKIAMMYTNENSLEEKVFKLALEDYKNSKRSFDFGSSPGAKVDISILNMVINKNDMYSLSHQLCKIANESVATIFSGSAEIPIPAVIQSYASAFEIPHLTFQTGISELNSAFELQPRFERAIYELIDHFQWKAMTIVFDNFNEGAMQRLQEFIKGNQVVNTKFVFDDTSIETALKEMKLSRQTNILLFLSKNYTEIFFRKAAEKEMLTQKYHYVIADLRMPCRKVQFNISGKINITCFKLLEDTDNENQEFVKRWKQKYRDEMSVFEEHQLEVSLAYDSFKVLAEVLQHADLHRVVPSRVEYQTSVNKPCLNYTNTVAAHQTNIANLLSKLKMKGVTGNIEFTGVGLRKNYQLQILDVGFQTVHSKIADWSDQTGLVFEEGAEDGVRIINGPTPGTMRVTTVLSKPFVIVKEEFQHMYDDPEKRGQLRMEHMSGFLIDLMRHIMAPYNLTYEIKFVKDGAYGAMDADGTWNGMIGELLRGEADVALAPLTINSGRQQVVDFTKPYMTLGISIMMRKTSEKNSGLFSFLSPLRDEIWMCCLLAYMSVSVVLFLVSRFSSTEWENSGNEAGADGDSKSNFGIINCLWFSLGSFMQQGGDVCPNSLPGRVVASSWWFFTLIIISSYTANLAAFLTADRMKTPIKGAEDLAAQTAVEYGVLGSGSSKGFFEKSSVGTYQRMYSFMKDRNLFTKTTEEGVARVRDENDHFAFLMESIMMEYHNQQMPCNTVKVGMNLNTITYGLATPKDSPFLGNLTIQILELTEKNVIDKLKTDWWYSKSPCRNQDVVKTEGASRLTIDRVMGVFVLLTVALCIGVVVAIGDTFIVSCKQGFKWKIPVKDCFMANIKMALTSRYTLPVREDAVDTAMAGVGNRANYVPLQKQGAVPSLSTAESDTPSTINQFVGFSNVGGPQYSFVGPSSTNQKQPQSVIQPIPNYASDFQISPYSRVHTDV